MAESPPESSCPSREENDHGTAEGEEDGVNQLGISPDKRQCNGASEDGSTDSMDDGDDEVTESEDVETPNKGEHTSMRDNAHQESGYPSGLNSDSDGEGRSQHHHCYTIASGELHSANALKDEHFGAHWIFAEVRALPYSGFNVFPFHLRKMGRNSDGIEKQVARVFTFPSLLGKTP